MDETELAHRDLMQRLNSSTVTSSSKLPGLARGAYRGLPPTHPHHISPPSLYSQQISPPLPHHSRSLSQPVFFSQDSTLPYSSPPATFSAAMDHPLVRSEGLPPLKAHRRSHSDIPFGFLARPPAVKQESECSDGAGEDDTVGEDLFTAYMNLDSLDALNSSEDRRDDIDSRASGSKTNGGGDSSENEAESSSVNESRPQKEGNKRGAGGEPVRHCRSLSMDSFMGKLSFAEESPRISTVARTGQESPNVSFGNGEFSAAELKKVMASEKLAEIAMTDPRRVKRILANRQSAARSKERKTRYISELEHKVHTLQTEATTLSAQLTMFQRDYSGLNSQNNELKFRLQAMEQQAKLRDALNDALTGEVQRLKVAAAEMGESQLSNSLNRQIQLNPHMFQLHQLQKQQQQQYQFQQQQQQQQQEQSNSVSNNETNQ